MTISVLIEPVVGNGYLAKTGEPFALRAEGATRQDALENIKQLISQRMRAGSEVASIELPNNENPWLAMAGIFDPNDPEIIAWKNAMAENRAESDANPDYL